MSSITKLLFSILLASAVFLVASPAFAQLGLETTAGAAGLTKYNRPVPEIAGNVIGAALSLIAVLFFGLMIYGGFLWMTAHGKEDQTKKALEAITAAIIGIIIVVSAYAITRFVFTSVQGGELGSGSSATNKCQWDDGVSPCKGQVQESACPTDNQICTYQNNFCFPTVVVAAIGGTWQSSAGDPCALFVNRNVGNDAGNADAERRICETMNQHCKWNE